MAKNSHNSEPTQKVWPHDEPLKHKVNGDESVAKRATPQKVGTKILAINRSASVTGTDGNSEGP